MSETRRRRELARADRVLPGLWRLRLPLPWPGVPHVNAFAIAAGSGVVLVDTGLYEPGGMRQLEYALDQAGLRLEHVRLLVCTHAHSDHYGLAGPIIEAAGCELWMHPNHRHMTKAAADPTRAFERRLEVARQSGVPLDALERYRAERGGQGYGVAEIVMPDRDLVPGVEVDTDLGRFDVYETPGPRPLARGAPPARSRAAPVRATTCSAASRSSTTTAGRPTRPASSSTASTWWATSTCSSSWPATAGPVRDARALVAANRKEVERQLDVVRAAIADRAAHPVRDRARPGGRRLRRDGGELGPVPGAQLPGPPGAAGRGRAR